MYSLKQLLYESLKKYPHMRPYTQTELDYEVDEYLKNDYTKSKLPKMWKDKDDGYADIKMALHEYPSEEELRSLENSDVGEILDTPEDDRMKKAVELAKGYYKNYKAIIDGLNKKTKFPAPIVVRDKSKRLYLLGGNTRLMLGVAMGLNLPIKIIDWKKEIQ